MISYIIYIKLDFKTLYIFAIEIIHSKAFKSEQHLLLLKTKRTPLDVLK